MYRTADIYFTEYEVESDESLTPYSSIYKTHFGVQEYGDYREQFTLDSNSAYGAFFFNRSRYTQRYDRSYQKVDQLMSEIGGFVQSIVVVIAVLVEFFNQEVYTMDLINQIYEFDLDEDSKKNLNKTIMTSATINQPKGPNNDTQKQATESNQQFKQDQNDSKNIQSCETPKQPLINIDQIQSQENILFKSNQIQFKNYNNSPSLLSNDKRRVSSCLPLDKQNLFLTNNDGNSQILLPIQKKIDQILNEDQQNMQRNSDESIQNTPKQHIQQNMKLLPSYKGECANQTEEKSERILVKKQNSLFYEQMVKQKSLEQQDVQIELKEKQNSNFSTITAFEQKCQDKPCQIDQQGYKQEEILNTNDFKQNQKTKQSFFQVFKGIKDATSRFTQILSQGQKKSQSNQQQENPIGKIKRSNTEIGEEEDTNGLNKSLNNLKDMKGQTRLKEETSNNAKDQSNGFLNAYRSQMRKDFLKKQVNQIFKKHKKLKLSLKYFLFQISCGKLYRTKENLMIMHSRKLLDQDLDIISILNKIKEIEKIKYLLFNQNQLTLFNYFPKPLLCFDENDHIDFKNQIFKKKDKQAKGLNIQPQVLNVVKRAKSKFKKIHQKGDQNSGQNKEQKQQFQISLNNQKSELNNFEQLYEAYENIYQLKQRQRYDDILINMLGDNLKNIFELSYKQLLDFTILNFKIRSFPQNIQQRMGFGIDKLQFLIQKNTDTPRNQQRSPTIQLKEQQEQKLEIIQLEQVDNEEQNEGQANKGELILFQQDSDSSI